MGSPIVTKRAMERAMIGDPLRDRSQSTEVGENFSSGA